MAAALTCKICCCHGRRRCTHQMKHLPVHLCMCVRAHASLPYLPRQNTTKKGGQCRTAAVLYPCFPPVCDAGVWYPFDDGAVALITLTELNWTVPPLPIGPLWAGVSNVSPSGLCNWVYPQPISALRQRKGCEACARAPLVLLRYEAEKESNKTLG